MHAILAENLNGWLFGAAVLFGGLLASVLALCALVPARQGNRGWTWALVSPAFVVGLLVTVGAGYGMVTDGVRDGDYSVGDFAIPWLVLAGPSLATGLLAVVVLGLRMRRSAGP
jgi:hypothetical protein